MRVTHLDMIAHHPIRLAPRGHPASLPVACPHNQSDGGASHEPQSDTCKVARVLSIERTSVSGFRLVRASRVWDDPDRRDVEKSIDKELARLADQIKSAFDKCGPEAWPNSAPGSATPLRPPT